MGKEDKEERSYKKEYETFQKKHNLPDFQKLVEDFDVGKFLEKEPTILMRDIRRAMAEKFAVYSQFFENLINPASPSLLLLSVIKKLSKEDKEKIRETYRKIAGLQVKAMKLDIIYSEKAEIKFVKETFEEWQKLKVKIKEIVDNFDEEQSETTTPTDRGYFG